MNIESIRTNLLNNPPEDEETLQEITYLLSTIDKILALKRYDQSDVAGHMHRDTRGEYINYEEIQQCIV